MKTFYLGIHRPNWLSDPALTDVPVFISRRVFYNDARPPKTLPRAVGRYAVDSGGFTELQQNGQWTISPAEYVAFLRRLWQETGRFDFAAPMDRMCEPFVIYGGVDDKGNRYVGTRQFLDPENLLSFDQLVELHQRLTVANFLELRRLAPDLPIMPVVQGWTIAQYLRCVQMYRDAGVDLAAEPVVAVGSVCRRQNTAYATGIIDALLNAGVRNLHGFGFQIEGLDRCWDQLTTADTMSWSRDGRHAGPCKHPTQWRTRDKETGRPRRPRSEGNCLEYALGWRTRHIHRPLRRSRDWQQLDLATDVEVTRPPSRPPGSRASRLKRGRAAAASDQQATLFPPEGHS